MKNYWRVAFLFIIVIVVLPGFLFFRQATAPESAVIAGERSKFTASRDKQRMKTDPVYAYEFESKLRFLDYRLAVAYNKENKPGAAIRILDGLISAEEAGNKDGASRHSRSFLDEARYFEALQESYILEQDEVGAASAGSRRSALLADAEAARKRERLEEGRSVTGPNE